MYNGKYPAPHLKWHFHDYTQRHINLYRMFVADISVKSQPIFMKVSRQIQWNFHQKLLYT